MTITHPPLVVPFHYRGDDSRPMRVVVSGDNDATVEEPQGSDALGVERWSRVEMEGVDEHGSLEAYAHEWAEMVACALAHYLRARLPSGDAPPHETTGNVSTGLLRGWATNVAGIEREQMKGLTDEQVLGLCADRIPIEPAKGGDAPKDPSNPDGDALDLVDSVVECLMGTDGPLGLAWEQSTEEQRDDMRGKLFEAALGSTASRPQGGAGPGDYGLALRALDAAAPRPWAFVQATGAAACEVEDANGGFLAVVDALDLPDSPMHDAGVAAFVRLVNGLGPSAAKSQLLGRVNAWGEALCRARAAEAPGPEHEALAKAWGRVVKASEGAAPPPQPEGKSPVPWDNACWTGDDPEEPAELDDLGRTIGEALKPGPSGVPDAPGPWLLDGLPVAVEPRGDLKWRDVHNGLWRTVQPEEAWGGRCTPDAGLRKRVEAVLGDSFKVPLKAGVMSCEMVEAEDIRAALEVQS